MPLTSVPKPLREKLGDEASDSLVELVNQAMEVNKRDVIEVVSERFERRLAEEIGKLRVEMHDELGKIRGEMHSLKADIIKWMFLFWAGQIFAILGILLAFFR